MFLPSYHVSKVLLTCNLQGSMMGPMIGGALSYPCTIFPHFPLCEEGALFERRCAAVSLLAF